MSDYDHSQYRRYGSRNARHIDTGGSGTGLVWALVVIAALAGLVLITGLSGGSTSVDHPGGAGADPIVVQPESQSGATGAAID